MNNGMCFDSNVIQIIMKESKRYKLILIDWNRYNAKRY